ncbi:MAG: hypothetical protein LUH02_04510 [Erysipelotrichaceae bacterium]|nr:hypothetical protein [Erysipelotrichaceae bacterium]
MMVYLIIVIIFWILILYGIYEIYGQLKFINEKLSQLLAQKERKDEEV